MQDGRPVAADPTEAVHSERIRSTLVNRATMLCNVTADAAALCVKSGNAVVLRGGSAAENTNRVLVELLQHHLLLDRAHGVGAVAGRLAGHLLVGRLG